VNLEGKTIVPFFETSVPFQMGQTSEFSVNVIMGIAINEFLIW
jgi:hypothetical protein